MEKKTVIIAFGGISPEHEVSVLTAMQAIAALEDSPYHLVPLYISKSGRWYTGDYLLKLEHYEHLRKVTENGMPCTFAYDEYGRTVLKELKSGFLKKGLTYAIDAMLIAFHGSDGENGSFQGLCETFNVPYTGSNVFSSAIGMDKVAAKFLCRAHGIPVVTDSYFSESQWEINADEIVKKIEELNYPAVVKPVHLGSSIGVTIVNNKKELTDAIELAFRYDEHLLVERAVKPLMEINCSVIGTSDNCRVSVCERPVGAEELLSFQDKYLSDSGETKGMASASRVIPADIPDELTARIQETSKKVFRIFRCEGVVRLDFLVNSESFDFYFNEINTIPGSFSFYLWEASGTNFSAILEELINLAVQRHKKKNGRVQSYDTNLLNQKAVKGLKGIKAKT